MKKILFLLLAIFFVSCECPYCGQTKCRCGYDDYGIIYEYDQFYANKLLGEWQICYGCKVGGIELKDIKFFSSKRCDIVMLKSRSIDLYTETWSYSYTGSYIRFYNNSGNSFSFKVKGYIYPELYLQDSFGEYTWRKIKPYDCIN